MHLKEPNVRLSKRNSEGNRSQGSETLMKSSPNEQPNDSSKKDAAWRRIIKELVIISWDSSKQWDKQTPFTLAMSIRSAFSKAFTMQTRAAIIDNRGLLVWSSRFMIPGAWLLSRPSHSYRPTSISRNFAQFHNSTAKAAVYFKPSCVRLVHMYSRQARKPHMETNSFPYYQRTHSYV